MRSTKISKDKRFLQHSLIKMITAIKIIYSLAALGAFLANGVFALMAAEEITEEIAASKKWYERNRFDSVMFHPEDLTEKGRKYRKLHLTFLGLFAGMIPLGAMVSYMFSII